MSTLEPGETPEFQCPMCRATGEAYLFHPLTLQADESLEAMPEDATCIHHPAKQAVTQCAGTGDYVCALCAVEINGKTYSAQYMNTKAGKKNAAEAFDRYLERPDRAASTMLLLTLLFMILAPITIPAAIYYYFKSRSLRKKNPLYARVIKKTTSKWVYIVLLIIFILIIGAVVIF